MFITIVKFYFKELVKDNMEMNYIMSPLSLLFPLSLLALYTTGKSNVQLLTALNARDKEEVQNIFFFILINVRKILHLTYNAYFLLRI